MTFFFFFNSAETCVCGYRPDSPNLQTATGQAEYQRLILGTLESTRKVDPEEGRFRIYLYEEGRFRTIHRHSGAVRGGLGVV